MKKIKVTAHLATEMIMNSTTLDGILGSILYDQLDNFDLAHASIPIKKTDGLFHASCAMANEVLFGTTHFYGGLRAQHDIELDHIQKNKEGSSHRKIRNGSTEDYGSFSNTYRTIATMSVSWLAECDPEAVEKLLSDIEFIGKRRSSGFGQVKRWDFEETDNDPIIDTQGYPLRPIPTHLWNGKQDAIRTDAAWRPAYWNTEHRSICVVPETLFKEMEATAKAEKKSKARKQNK